ncbi:MAG TPA: hypothetical protein VFS62_13860 [Chloroflexota bacterium]|jgi:hypothetical protein|nr:hypothetical protein [Chloroflexota bacterium]
MARYLVVAHQTALSTELREQLGQLKWKDPRAEFVLLVPATPVGSLMLWEEGESADIAQRRAEETRRVLEQDELKMLDARVGDHRPLDAIMDEFRDHGPYQGIVLSTFPPGMSKWLGMDLPTQLRRKFPDVPLMHVMSAPRAAEDVSSGRRYKTQSLP